MHAVFIDALTALRLPGAGADGPVAVPAATAEALRYYASGNTWWIVNTLLGLLIPALFLFTGYSARLRTWCTRPGRPWFFALALYYAGYTLITFLLDIPRYYFQDFVREHAYGLSNQTPGKWALDAVMGLVVDLVLGLLVLWIPYLLLKKSPTRWWLYTTALTIPLLFVFTLIAPVYIVPLFNHATPLRDKALESRILTLADRAGMEGIHIYELETSVDSNRLNAAAVGFGSTRRVFLTDTLIKQMNQEEVLFGVGHELGHYVLGHHWKTLFFLAALTAAILFSAKVAANRLLRRFAPRFGFDRLSDFASLPLLILLVNVYSLVVTPAYLAFTRANEHEADRFGLELTRDNHAAASGFVKIQREKLGNPYPGPLYVFFREGHPPLGERIEFCNQYKPWEHGEPLRYSQLIKAEASR